MTVQGAATKLDVWEYQKFVTDPVSSPLGKRNRFLGEAPPLPELKANLQLTWVRVTIVPISSLVTLMR